MSPERTDYNSWNVCTMFSFHLKVINVNFIVGRAVTQLKEGVEYFHPIHYSKDTLGPAAAPAQLCQGKVRPWPVAGKASVMHVPFGVVQILSIHGAVSSASAAMALQFSTAQDSSAWKEKGSDRWNQATLLKYRSKHQREAAAAFCGFQNLKPLSPPINSHPRLQGNKPRLGTCLKGELSIAKLYHIRKCWQTLPE